VIKAGVGLPAVGIMASGNNTIVNGIPREAALEGRGCLGECEDRVDRNPKLLSTSFGAMDFSPVLDLFL
jgi:hypothetical protein